MPTNVAQRKLVVFFSYNGSTRVLAEAVALAVDADLTEILPAKPYSSFRPWVLFWGGFQAWSRRIIPLQPTERNPEAYAMLFIGTPIWAGNMAPPVRSWLAGQRLKGKRIACFASSGGGEAGRAFSEIRAALPDNTFMHDLVSQAQHGDLAAARLARSWAQQVIQE
ncbi:MAG: hypothetical protein LLG44_14420 [Chloroflexi bacterium]|nr:hypothetical protein [Chloroflexota bacterium]